MQSVKERVKLESRIEQRIGIESHAQGLANAFGWRLEHAKNVVVEYCRFLQLKIECHDIRTKKLGCGWFVDKAWMAHAAKTESYAMDCIALVGDLVPYHLSSVDQVNRTLSLYKEKFGTYSERLWSTDCPKPKTVEKQSKMPQMLLELFTDLPKSPTKCIVEQTTKEYYNTDHAQPNNHKETMRMTAKPSRLVKIKLSGPRSKDALHFKVSPFEKCYRVFRSYAIKIKIDYTNCIFKHNNKVIDPQSILNAFSHGSSIVFQCHYKSMKSTMTPMTDPAHLIGPLDPMAQVLVPSSQSSGTLCFTQGDEQDAIQGAQQSVPHAITLQNTLTAGLSNGPSDDLHMGPLTGLSTSQSTGLSAGQSAGLSASQTTGLSVSQTTVHGLSQGMSQTIGHAMERQANQTGASAYRTDAFSQSLKSILNDPPLPCPSEPIMTWLHQLGEFNVCKLKFCKGGLLYLEKTGEYFIHEDYVHPAEFSGRLVDLCTNAPREPIRILNERRAAKFDQIQMVFYPQKIEHVSLADPETTWQKKRLINATNEHVLVELTDEHARTSIKRCSVHSVISIVIS